MPSDERGLLYGELEEEENEEQDLGVVLSLCLFCHVERPCV